MSMFFSWCSFWGGKVGSPLGKRPYGFILKHRVRPAVFAFISAWAVCAGAISTVRADAFSSYQLQGSFQLPNGASGLEALPDGRLLTVAGHFVHVESAAGTRAFAAFGTLADADFSSFGPGFVRVSPDGTRVAVGNGGGASFGNYEVGVFALSDLSGTWFSANHFDAAWVDNRSIALTGSTFGSPSYVSFLDTTSVDTANPFNPIAIDGIGGASGGITFDTQGYLYTGNGFAISGPSGTGVVKAFSPGAWVGALTSGTPLSFESSGMTVVDILSGGSLGFDDQGNLFVGGGDFTGADQNFAALIHASAVAGALSGGGAVDVLDMSQVRRLDPDGNSSFNFYGATFNETLHELYVYDGGMVFVYAVPEPVTALLLCLALLGIHVTTKETKNMSVVGVVDAHSRFSLLELRALRGEKSLFNKEVGSPFAAEVVLYDPAPGQFVNNPLFNDPAEALGPPDGMGTTTGNITSVVNLGGFGGTLVLRFDHLVEDHPLNPLGLDAIVFGNAFWVGGDPEARWAECATIEIGLDADDSGDIDNGESWFLIPGSHLDAQVAGRNTKTWDDDISDNTYPPALASWVPAARSGQWTSHAFALPFDVFSPPVLFNEPPEPGEESVFGYADSSPTLLRGDLDGDDIVDDEMITSEEFYTVPDDPFSVGINAGSGGGDAFDIAWAVEPATGAPAGLSGFNMLRITNAVDAELGPLGEKSPEIDAAADVSPDPFGDADADEDIDLRDLSALWNCFGLVVHPADFCLVFSEDHGSVGGVDAAAVLDRITGPRSAS